jgi:hypothetical protein
MDVTTLVTAVIVVFVLATVLLAWFVGREIRKTHAFFGMLATQFDGKPTRLPFGVVFDLEGIRVRIYALQGSIQYRAKVRLRNDPGILVTRTFRKLEFLDKLNYSGSREKLLLHAPVDQQYGFRAKDGRWMREIFNADLLDSMTAMGRVTRIEITRRVVRGALLMLNHSNQEIEKAKQSISILNRLVMQVSRSTLALHQR